MRINLLVLPVEERGRGGKGQLEGVLRKGTERKNRDNEKGTKKDTLTDEK